MNSYFILLFDFDFIFRIRNYLLSFLFTNGKLLMKIYLYLSTVIRIMIKMLNILYKNTIKNKIHTNILSVSNKFERNLKFPLSVSLNDQITFLNMYFLPEEKFLQIEHHIKDQIKRNSINTVSFTINKLLRASSSFSANFILL